MNYDVELVKQKRDELKGDTVYVVEDIHKFFTKRYRVGGSEEAHALGKELWLKAQKEKENNWIRTVKVTIDDFTDISVVNATQNREAFDWTLYSQCHTTDNCFNSKNVTRYFLTTQRGEKDSGILFSIGDLYKSIENDLIRESGGLSETKRNKLESIINTIKTDNSMTPKEFKEYINRQMKLIFKKKAKITLVLNYK